MQQSHEAKPDILQIDSLQRAANRLYCKQKTKHLKKKVDSAFGGKLCVLSNSRRTA
jgi:hypothetical protein